MGTKQILLGSVCFLASALVTAVAQAQSSPDIDKIDRLQRQVEQLQEQLKARTQQLEEQLKLMKSEMAQAKRKATPADAAQGANSAATPGAVKPQMVTATAATTATVKAAAAPPPAPSATVKMSANNRPSICSADGQNCIALTSRVFFDAGGYSYHPNSPATTVRDLDDGVNARSARFGVLGTFLSDWRYGLIYEFGGASDGFGNQASGPNANSPSSGPLPGGRRTGIDNAYLQFAGLKGDGISSVQELGYINVPYTMYQNTSLNDILFMERASAQVVAVEIAAGTARAAGGTNVYTDRFWAGAYATGPRAGDVHINQSTSTVNGQTEQLGSTGRMTYQLLQEKDYTLHIGGDAEFLIRPPSNTTSGIKYLSALADRPEIRLDPTQLISTGTINYVSGAQVYSGELAGSYGPLFVQGEYFWYNIDRQFGLPALNFNGGYVEAGLVLSGESTRPYLPASGSYGTIIPKNPFSLATGGLGAFEIAARYSYINLNDLLGNVNGVTGGKQNVVTAGLNWYVNQNVEFTLNYLHGTVDRQTSPLVANNAGSKYDAAGMRMQVAF